MISFKDYLTEAIKGWKHAHSDLAKARAAASSASNDVKLVRLKKDGKESGMHDATKTFKSEDEARAHHKRMTELNPGKGIAHNLYVGGEHKEVLKEELDEENLHRVIGQVYSDDDQKWYHQSYTTRAKSREHAVQKAKEQFGKRGQKFRNVEHDAEIHEEFKLDEAQGDDFDDIKVGDKIVVHKFGSFGSKKVGTHTVTKVLPNHFTVDREDEDGKHMKFKRRNGESVATKESSTGKGAYGVRGFKSGHKAFKAKIEEEFELDEIAKPKGIVDKNVGKPPKESKSGFKTGQRVAHYRGMGKTLHGNVTNPDASSGGKKGAMVKFEHGTEFVPHKELKDASEYWKDEDDKMRADRKK